MNLAAKACQGVLHCRSFSAWTPHDTVIAVIVVVLLLVVVLVAKR